MITAGPVLVLAIVHVRQALEPLRQADARHSWLDALSSAGALAGLVAVAFGQPWGDPVAGLAVTAFICHVGSPRMSCTASPAA